MEPLDSTIVNTAVPSMAASLHVTPLSLKAVAASYILSLAVCIPVSGWTADRYGTRRVFALAIAVFTISSEFCGLAMNVTLRRPVGKASEVACGDRVAARGKYAPSVSQILTGKFEAEPTIGAGDQDCCCHRTLSVPLNARPRNKAGLWRGW
jgi:MFS family permease